jgi:hypothetical protein
MTECTHFAGCNVREVDVRTQQLRIYRSVPDRFDEFLEVWRELVVPMRRRFGFRIEHAWALREESALVWVVSLPGDEDDFRRKYQEYMAYPHRDEINARFRPLMRSQSEFYFAEPLDLTTGASLAD